MFILQVVFKQNKIDHEVVDRFENREDAVDKALDMCEDSDVEKIHINEELSHVNTTIYTIADHRI